MPRNVINRTLSRQKIDYLFFHLLDGFKTTHEGLTNIKNTGAITQAEYFDLVVKNTERLMCRVDEFKTVNKLLCFFFAGFFVWLQVAGNGPDLRRARRVRIDRRRYEAEIII